MNKKLRNFLLSLLIPCIACGIQWVFWDKFQPFIWFLFYPAVFFSAQVGGRWGGIAATLLSALLVIFFFVEPVFSLRIIRLNVLYSTTVFILMGVLFSSLQERFKQGQQKLQESESALRKLNIELEERAETTLSTLAERLNLATKAAQMGIWDWDIQKDKLIWDDQMYKLYGVNKEEFPVAYEAWLNGVHPDDRDFSNEISQQAVRGEKEYDTEFRVVWRDGTVHWLKANGQVFRNENSEPIRMVGVNYDITERKLASEEILKSAERYRMLFEYAPDGIVIADSKFYYTDVNANICRMLGYTRDELIGLHASNIVVPVEKPRINDTLYNEVNTRPDYKDEWMFKRKDGSTFIAEVISATMPDGNPLGVIRDITERRRAEEALHQRTEELEQLLDILPEAIWIANDPECKVIRGNRFANELLGVSEQENISQSAEAPAVVLRQFSQGRELSPDELPMQLAARTGQPQVDFELRIERPYAVTRTLLGGAVPLFDSLGRTRGVVAGFQDITERKQAEEELRESEASLKQSQAIAHVGHWSWDTQSNQVKWSDEMHRIFGIDPQTFSGDLNAIIARAIHPDDREKVTLANEAVVSEQTPATLEYRVIWPDDSIHVVSAIPGERITDENGNIVRLTGIVQDITERKQAEAALRESEKLFSTAFHSSPIAITITNQRNGKYIEVNNAWCSIYGFTAKEAIGHTPMELSTIDNETRQRLIDELQTKGKLANVELSLKDKAGNYHTILFSSENIELAGEPCVLSTGIEITERKRAEEELHASKKLLQDVVDNTAALVYILDLEGRFLLVNHRLETLFGLPNAQIVDQTRNAFMPAEFAALHRRNDLEIIQTGQGKLFEEENLEPDGRHIYLTNKFPLFDTHNQVYAVCGISTDMTERKQMEEELHRSNTELEQFAYIASHDLQEPLRAVAGMVQLLGQRYKGKLDERADEYIGHAVEASQRMQKLITDLLDYSRVNRFGKPLEPTRLENSLNNALNNLQISIQESGASITHDALPTVMADPVQITQVLQNLIANAIKFHGEKAPQIHIGAQKINNEWQFEIRDNGIGIESQYFERIFLIFQRLHTRSEYPGTGIGLSLCKKIIERHGGRIWVTSQPGQGSTFLFTLPEKRS
jgi:PAS domain S-box-containing protein